MAQWGTKVVIIKGRRWGLQGATGRGVGLWGKRALHRVGHLCRTMSQPQPLTLRGGDCLCNTRQSRLPAGGSLGPAGPLGDAGRQCF